MKSNTVTLLLVAAAVVVASPGMVQAQDACNVLANPGFDEAGGSFNGWFVFGNAFVSAPDEPFRSAPASAKMFGNFTGGFNVSGFGQAFAAAAGETYTMTGHSLVSSADPLIGVGAPDDNWVVMKIAFFNAPEGGDEIGAGEVIIADGTSPQDEWLFNSVGATAPDGTQRVEALFLFLQPCTDGECDGGSVFIDDASLGLEGAQECDDGDACTLNDQCIEGQCVGEPIECAEGEVCIEGECVPEPPEQCNLFANPGFDDNGGSFDGWFTFGNAFVSAPDEVWRSAPASGKMFGLFSGGFNVSGVFQAFPANGGETYYMTSWSQIRSADPLIGDGPPLDNWVVMKLAFFDAPQGGNEIGAGEVNIGDGTFPQDVWLFNSVSATAPDGTQRVEAFFLFLQPCDGGECDPGAIFFDDATLGLGDQCADQRSLIIKQEACPAPVNQGSRGVIPMVLAGDDGFDVSEVVVESLDLHSCGGTFSGLAPLNGPPGPKVTIDNVNNPFEGDVNCDAEPCACKEDHSPDGIDDLKLKFSTEAFAEAFGDLPGGAIVPLELSGELTNGTSFFARDCVLIVPPEGIESANATVESNAQSTYVELSPLDLNVDSDGFTDFGRSYQQSTEITVSAPIASDARRFLHWTIDGSEQPFDQTTIVTEVSEDMSLEAVYHECRADMNVDNAVDFRDLLALLADWGPCEGGCAYDVTGDEVVDFSDILVLLASWGPCL